MFSASKTAVVGGYRIANSLRFRSSASAYLSRNPASAGSLTTWTWAGWVKRGKLSVAGNYFINANDGGFANRLHAQFGTSNNIEIYGETSGIGTQVYAATTAVYRDPSAWYHIILVLDTTQSFGANRVRLYVNGVQQTLNFTNTPSQNTPCRVNSTLPHYINSYPAVSDYGDGYLADVHFIDGQALDPTSFGAFNAITGVWGPKRYTGTYGTNGFKLNFSNGTSTTTLGYDSSGNGNNWTTNNISLTAGSTYDWMLDSPTPFAGTSYGVGNYCTLNPLDQGNTTAYATNANLTATGGSGNAQLIYGTMGMGSGKWYWEATVAAVGGETSVGISLQTEVSNASTNYVVGDIATGYGYYVDGRKHNNGAYTTYGASYTTNDVLGIAFDADAGSLTFYKNGTSQGVAFSSIPAGSYKAAFENRVAGGTSILNVNFGQRPFAYTPPSGYKSLCTYNLPTPTIQNGAGYMAATLYTGTGSSLSVSNTVNSVSFQPDFVWIKSRSAATDHALYDVIRGTQNRLESNTTDAAVAADAGLTAFGASGFTVNTLAQVNTNAATYVGWQWKAGGTAVTNTAGSITSSVSANTTSGFSVVTYTGTGSNATVGHGLGVAPSLIIVKCRGAASQWGVYHAYTDATPQNYALLLNSTAAKELNSLYWNNTAPTTSVFSLGGSSAGNTSGQTQVAYCFAAIPGYSAFGSYTGNGSADGPFVYCGFRPRFVMIKSSSNAYSWYMEDSSRNVYNPTDLYLEAPLSSAEGSLNPSYDFLSNGFKLRTTNANFNGSGATFIYAAFAENPFTNALAR